MTVHPRAGQPAEPADLVDVPHLVTAYYAEHPDPGQPPQQVSFGTSGHRGSSLRASFNEDHIVATSQAICEYRAGQGIDGPLFLVRDTHALSEPAMVSALEVFAANGVTVLVDSRGGYTPTPALSHAILTYNRGRTESVADGVVVTPSHNPPDDGGFKYNPPNGGPADTDITKWIQDRANALLPEGRKEVRRIPYARAKAAETTGRYDYVGAYVDDLPSVLDMDAIRSAGVRIGADPLGGASVAYWGEIGERHRLDLTVGNPVVDPTFRFMTLDWDGKIRRDCSSPYAMASLIEQRAAYQVATGNDADADRHGIVTPDAGLMNPNHYLAVAIDYLFRNRTDWPGDAAVGKTLVSSPPNATDPSSRPGTNHLKPTGTSSIGGPGPADAGGAGRFQVVRARPARRVGGVRRRGERGGVVPAPRRVGVDHGQGRHHPVPARLGDHRDDRAVAERALHRSGGAVRRAGL